MTIKIGISACLTGQQVRFDSGHKRSDFCMNELAKHVEYVPFCPEVAVGLPIPRPTIRQVRIGDVIKVCRPDGSNDVADDLYKFGQSVASNHLSKFSGFIFCAKSPSCGMERVKVYNETATWTTHDGVGVFAKAIMDADPLLPCEENGRLNDPHLRENFVMRIYVYSKWKELVSTGVSLHKMTTFHAQHKYLLMSHKYQAYKALGRMLGESHERDVDQVARDYIIGLMTAISKPASRKAQTNTLMHLQGYFKKHLSKIEKQELSEAIEEYRIGNVPLYVPLTLLSHHTKVHDVAYLKEQVYFAPYPNELKLRFGI
ncbi:COG1683: Uncharacterized conserved protein / FIG143828: Hypothetical protein YbgA [Pseudoalteromonas luteoviolacea B = ATCC 29581]|nr:COG1683: Uncharacterized conserved protein / FIG143828: Hypothetical protein YbgA [Pseudoalteromonas luteoviolacea B = ATCC 29581]